MNKRIDIWNVLHDGEITAVSGEGSQNIIMFVNIPYLRRRLNPIGDSFVLKLNNLKQIEFINFDGTINSLSEQLNIGSPEILSTESESMPITIETTLGKLILNFEDISFSLDTGEPIEFNTIEKVCEEYWKEWESRIKKE
jgi:hypothetical protein